MRSILIASIAALGLSVVAVPAAGGLIGDTIHGVGAEVGGETFFDADAVVSDSGREFISSFPDDYRVFADFDADTVTVGIIRLDPHLIGLYFWGTGWRFDFTDLDWVDIPSEITGLTLLSNDWDRPWSTSFTDDSITLDTGFMNGVGFDGEGDIPVVTWRIETMPVPLPGVGLLVVVGVGIVSLMKRKTLFS
jgi:hypothetical protein